MRVRSIQREPGATLRPQRGAFAPEPSDPSRGHEQLPAIVVAFVGGIIVGAKFTMCLRVSRSRLAAIAQVAMHHAAPAIGEVLAQRVGPGEHRRLASEQELAEPASCR